MRQTRFVAPILVSAVALMSVTFGLATTQTGCEPSSSAEADAAVDATSFDGGGTDSSVPGQDAAPDGATSCAKHLPSGFTNVVASASDTELGFGASMALDENDDPMFAYLVYASAKATLQFVRWDACNGAFTTPETVDSLGGVGNNPGDRQVSIAYDPTTKEIGIAYQKVVPDPGLNDATVVWLATRKPGAAGFATSMVSAGKNGDLNGAGTPSIAMNAGKVYIAYVQNNYSCGGAGGGCSGVWFLESTATDPDGGAGDAGPTGRFFTHTTIPFGGDVAQARFDSVSLAVNSAGVPAVAFYQPPPTAYTTTLLFWRKGMAEAVKVADSNNIQNDNVDVNLRFEGTMPRIAGHLRAAATTTYDLIYAASVDGLTWGTPIQVPRDGTATTAFTSALALDGKGNAAVAAGTNNSTNDTTCADPYLARSANGTTWTACGADTTKSRKWSVDALSAVYGTSRISGKLTLGFHNANIQGEQAGVVYWQE
jgi:hypothetical protein